MNRNKLCSLLVIMLWIIVCGSAAGEEVAQYTGFNKGVINKSISLLPDEIKGKLQPLENEILAGAYPKPVAGKLPAEPCYYIKRKTGNGPKALADQLKLTDKRIREGAADPIIAQNLGSLARIVIGLCQPFHTDEAAFISSAHNSFEKSLDESCASFDAKFDGFTRVGNPSQYGTALAGRANDLFKKLGTDDSSTVPNEVFKLAVNSVIDSWLTLLVPPAQPAQNQTQAQLNNQTVNGSIYYIGNTNSLKFHLPTCRFLPSEKNRIRFNTREEAISRRYVPCKVCKP